MDPHKLISLVVGHMNDEAAVRPYGHGFLLALPLTYWDDDSVTVFVEPFENGFKVTDQGATAVRLHMAGMNLSTPRVVEAWSRSVAASNLFNPTDEELEIAHFTAIDELGETIVRVAEASMRVDQLRWLHTPQPPGRFTERVVRRLGVAVGDRGEVRANALLQLRHGRERHVTAAVRRLRHGEIYVQAVSGGTRDQRERSVEHCTFLFNQAADLPVERRLAVAAGARSNWDGYFVRTLEETCSVAFFDEPTELDDVLSAQLARS